MKKIYVMLLMLLGFSFLTSCQLDKDILLGNKEPHEHVLVPEWTQNEDYHWHACSGCDKIVEKEEHDFGSWVEVKEATEYEAGEEKRECICGYTETRKIEKLDHTHKPTGEYGHNDKYHWETCSECDAQLNKKSHTGGVATCQEKATCSICNVQYGSLSNKHVYGEYVVISEATCKERAIEEATCTVDGCQAKDTRYVPGSTTVGHKWGEWTYIEGSATCLKDGIEERGCLTCSSKEKRTAEGTKLAHHAGSEVLFDENGHWNPCDVTKGCTEKLNVVAHSFDDDCDEVCNGCTYKRQGHHTYDNACDKVCNICNAERYTPDHTGGTATCLLPAICSECGVPYGLPLEHTYHNACDATCNMCGLVTRVPAPHKGGTATCEEKAICSECGLPYGELASHRFGTWVPEVPATCEETGTKGHQYCSVCKKNYDEHGNIIVNLTIAATGHKLGSLNAKVDPTCTEVGKKAHYECLACHTYFDETKENKLTDLIITEVGHDLKYNALVPADCENSGIVAHYHCNTCGKDYEDSEATKELATIIISAKGHNYGEWIPAKSETCEENGNLGHFDCSECDKYFDINREELEEVIIPATQHDWSTELSGKDADKHGYQCNNCGEFDPERLDAHTPGAAATENTDQICTVCQYVLVPATNHVTHTADESTWITNTTQHWHKCVGCDAAVESSRGDHVYDNACDTTCNTCNYIRTITHNYLTQVTEPTCTEKGYTTHTCSECGDVVVDTYTNVIEHSYDSVVTEPTCTEKGYTTRTCSECGDVVVDTYVDALEHEIVIHEAKAQTCTEIGWNSYVTCEKCDYSTYEEIPADGHHHVEVEDGIYLQEKCSCGDLGKKYLMVYLRPSAYWLQKGGNNNEMPRFAVYCFNNGTTWKDMVDSNNDGIYEAKIEAKYTNIIFCRMSPDNNANNWDNKWNQTADLATPNTSSTLYTVKEKTWDNGGGTWSEYNEADFIKTIYFLNNQNWTTVNAYIWSDSYGTVAAWPGTKVTNFETNSDGVKVYSIEVNVVKYNLVVFNNGSTQTVDLSLPTDYKTMFAITGSNGTKKTGSWTCNHNYSTELTYDDDTHYYACLNLGCDSKKDKQSHKNNATCTEGYTCDCGKVFAELGHNEQVKYLDANGDEIIPSTSISCNQKVLKVTYCVNGCGSENSVSIEGKDLLGSGLAVVEHSSPVDATCKAAGYCDYCKNTIAPQDPNKHKGEYVPNDDATCTTNGTQTRVCELCGDTDTIEVADSKLEHDFSEWNVEIEPTPTNDGIAIRKCERTGCEVKETLIIKALVEGNYNAASVIVVPATCTLAGSETYTIKDLKDNLIATYTVNLPELGHNWSDWGKEVVEGSETGNLIRECLRDNCDEIERKTNAHTCEYVYTLVTDPTVDSNGSIKKSCTVEYCGNVSVIVIPALEKEVYKANVTENLILKFATTADCLNSGEETYQILVGNITYTYLVNTNAYGHSLSDYLQAEDKHYKECMREGCDYATEAVACSGGEATCVAKAVCSTCGNEYGEKDSANHLLSENYLQAEDKHYKECMREGCDHTTEAVACTGGTATCTTYATCSECGSSYGTLTECIPSSTWSSDDKNHWKICASDVKCTKTFESSAHNSEGKDGLNAGGNNRYYKYCSVCNKQTDSNKYITLYLSPNSNWKQANARFAVYVWEGSNNTWINMTDADSDGIYEVEINVTKYPSNIIFCRMNPSSTTNGWTSNTQLWNQTSDLKIQTNQKNKYTVAEGAWSKGSGSWSAHEYNVDDTYYLLGDVNEWSITNAANYLLNTNPLDENQMVLYDIELPEGEFKIVEATEGVWYGDSNSNNITVSGGRYSIYFDKSTSKITVYPSVLYLQPNSNWSQGGKRFAAYFFEGDNEQWESMTDSDGDGIYECLVPVGYTNVIFCSMVSGINNWSECLYQTNNLVVPTDGTNKYYVGYDTYNKPNGSWSTYTPSA